MPSSKASWMIRDISRFWWIEYPPALIAKADGIVVWVSPAGGVRAPLFLAFVVMVGIATVYCPLYELHKS
jgi:hypothetical protein